MIAIEGLTVSYGENKVLDGLDLAFRKGAVHGVVGLNGSGKTTLLHTVFGLKRPDSGSVILTASGERPGRGDIAYLPVENFFYPNITGREYLGLFRSPGFDTDGWNGMFRLPLDQVIDGYSTGMKKKLALMGILKQEKTLLLLDEPFNGLDLETCRVLRAILLRLRDSGRTIVVTSHIMETLTNLCDELHFLEDGRIRYSRESGSFSEFRDEVHRAIDGKNAYLIDELMNGGRGRTKDKA